MKTVFLFILLLFMAISLSFAQHEHHGQPAKADTIPAKSDTAKHRHDTKKSTGMDHGTHDMEKMHSMPSHAYSRNLPMSRNCSGTGWSPDASPMYMWMQRGKTTDWMIHGSIFLRYTNTNLFNNNKRGGNTWDAPNWFMAMMNRRVGQKGLFNATAMISFDPLTEGGDGYPLLFQSGETWQGKKLVDRQHPHDLFSGLSIGYSQMISKDIDFYGYFGYPGEPALGAPAFMHRVSSMNNPDAPLGHHWQDATHITFGVATIGLRYKNFKLEASSFTGSEPDENRYNFDKPTFNSYSYRFSYNPAGNWALQFSQGFIKEPEALEPGKDVTRTTASVLYATATGKATHFSGALIWGLNNKGPDHKEHSILLESNYQFGRNAIFGRYEFVQKSAEELDLEDAFGHTTFNINVFSLGYNRSLLQEKVVEVTAGTKATINFPAGELESLYGKKPVGLQLYLQLRPILHQH